jgi:hypothetical protein
MGGSRPAPFAGKVSGDFGRTDVFLESVSAVFPVLAALGYHTQDGAFSGPVKKFVRFVRKNVHKKQLPSRYELGESGRGIVEDKLDIPFRVYSDLWRIQQILPEIETSDLVRLVVPYLDAKNPLMVFSVAEVFTFSIEACRVALFLKAEEALHDAIIKKCTNLIKQSTFPTRLKGSAEFGDFGLQTGFAFEGELIELFWKVNDQARAKSMIRNTLRECQFGSAITGIRNTTVDGKRSDTVMHPELFSRWLFNGVLMEAGIPFEDVVLSEAGHLLKLKARP